MSDDSSIATPVAPDPASGPQSDSAPGAPARDSQSGGLTASRDQLRDAGDALSALMGFAIIGAPVLYASWDHIPLVNTAKWIILAATVVLLGVIIASKRSKWMRSFFTVVFIVPGAAIACIYFGGQEQVLAFKLFAITYLSFLPPWLYLQFIASKGKALWEEYVLNLCRLQVDEYGALPPPPRSSPFRGHWLAETPDALNPPTTVYQRKFEGAFGPVQEDNTVRFRVENLWPVAIATMLISVGWVLVIQPETVFGFQFLGASFRLSHLPAVPLDTLRLGFIGSYFYVLQMLVRRYFQNDLKTGAYVSATMRVVVVALLIWALDLAFPATVPRQQLQAAAFVIGVFPDVGWQALVEVVKLPLKLVVPSLKQEYPLSDLDGLNLWYESRLLEEGIENLQNLVTANLVDLMLNTRVPVDRLVDWVDQATLFLHLGKRDRKDSDRARLRCYGIRTATDLQEALASPNAEHVRKLEALLNTGADAGEGLPSRLRCVADSFANEPNLVHVRAWRAYARVVEPAHDANGTAAPAVAPDKVRVERIVRPRRRSSRPTSA